MANLLFVVMLCCVVQDAPVTLVDNGSYAGIVERAGTEYFNGHIAQAEALLLSALRLSPPLDESQRAKTLSALGDVYVNEDELQKAERVYQESLAIYKKLRDQMKSSLLWRNLGSVYSLQRRDEEALSALREALKTARADPDADATLIGQTLNSLGVMYFRQGKLNKAEDVFNEAVRVLPMAEGVYARADLLNNLGAVYHAKREFRKADEYITRALNMTESQVGPRHPDLTFQLSTLGILYADTGQYAKAEEQFQRALAILEPAAPVYETRIARLLHGLSRTYAAAGRKADSEATLARAVVLARKYVAAHPDMALIMDEYAERLRNAGKKREAEELRVEARHARVAAGLVVNAHSPF